MKNSNAVIIDISDRLRPCVRSSGWNDSLYWPTARYRSK